MVMVMTLGFSGLRWAEGNGLAAHGCSLLTQQTQCHPTVAPGTLGRCSSWLEVPFGAFSLLSLPLNSQKTGSLSTSPRSAPLLISSPNISSCSLAARTLHQVAGRWEWAGQHFVPAVPLRAQGSWGSAALNPHGAHTAASLGLSLLPTLPEDEAAVAAEHEHCMPPCSVFPSPQQLLCFKLLLFLVKTRLGTGCVQPCPQEPSLAVENALGKAHTEEEEETWWWDAGE